ncbi:MAG: signal recognition particle-docking protein FtsY [Epsilonproteobacteria bacterium]|nr:MAG: signal recognition particle-docking protein FtsY [Campylobacterota bacterium]RLA63656.1 MAG: signal recognition particle-docking protein FtsY [Campylobacterota bacterium]
MESLIIYLKNLGLAEPNIGDVYGVLAILFVLLTGLTFLLTKKEKKVVKEEVTEEKIVEPPKGPSWSERLGLGLSKSRQEVWGKLAALLTGNKISDEQMEEMEEILYSSDLGPKMVHELMEALSSRNNEAEDFKDFLFKFLKDKIVDIQKDIDPSLVNFSPNASGKPKVIMVVGVNGVGKTTTIGKLATKFTSQGAKVVVGAGDTFRAAAVDQLEVWCERAGAEMIRAKEGSSPSGVGYQALEKAISEKADYCILDTAGRMHNKSNLMEELKKSKDVLKKLDPDAPWQVLLVIDAVTGQNAIRQAEEFNKALDLTGLIFTKCDGSSKAGAAIPIVQSLNVPITYIGVGESVDDLNPFVTDDYLKALLDY